MSTIDIFYRRDMILESMDLDLLPLTEGIGSNIANAFNRIRKAISNFFKNLIDRIKNLFNKNRKESLEINKKMSDEEAIEIARKSDKKFKKPVNELKSIDDALEVLDFINDDMPKIYEKFKDSSLVEFKDNFLNETGIGSIDNIDDFISSYFFTGKKITKVSDINMDVLFAYKYEERKKILEAITISKDKLIKKLDNFEKEYKREDSEYNEENIKKINFLYNTQIQCTDKVAKHFERAIRNTANIKRMLIELGGGRKAGKKNLTEYWYNALENKDILKLRIMMKDSLLIDNTFTQLDEMEKQVKNIEGMYDEHDINYEPVKELDKRKWDTKYMNRQLVALLFNFSHERIQHLKDVICYLYPL